MPKKKKQPRKPQPRRAPAYARPGRPAASFAPRRRPRWVVPAVIVGVVAFVAILVASVGSGDDDPETVAADGALVGVERFELPPPAHVTTPVSYGQTPPVGGDHDPEWMNCGAYTEPIPTEKAVHSMEHGAVWITYDPGLAPDAVGQLGQLGSEPYVVVSPWVATPVESPVVASAWGAQLRLTDPGDPRLTQFLDTFRQSADAPEPGAPCTGGAGAGGA